MVLAPHSGRDQLQGRLCIGIFSLVNGLSYHIVGRDLKVEGSYAVYIPFASRLQLL